MSYQMEKHELKVFKRLSKEFISTKNTFYFFDFEEYIYHCGFFQIDSSDLFEYLECECDIHGGGWE